MDINGPRRIIMVKYFTHMLGMDDYEYICPYCGAAILNPRREYCNNCLKAIDIKHVDVIDKVSRRIK